MTTREKERREAINHLRQLIKPGDTVYTVLRHVSRSGMTRGIDVYLMDKNGGEPVWITAYVGKAIDQPQPRDYWQKSLGLKIGGCGMDMGFHVVNSLSYALYGKGYQCLGRGNCPSNYHVNHRDTVQCEGTMIWNNDGPDTGERCQFESGKGWILPSTGKTCPKCKGKGRLPNPAGPERFDLEHKDGYALRHKWL